MGIIPQNCSIIPWKLPWYIILRKSWSCMYVYYIDSPKGCKFFWKVLSFYTHYTLSVPPYQPLSTGSGSILGAGASRASPGISIGRTAIVVVRTPYIWSYVSVLPYRWGFGLGNWTRGMLPSLLVTTPRRWPFPFGPTVLGGFRTTRCQKNT